jgi:hypothetical protein
VLATVVVAAFAAASGAERTDPRTPPGAPGMPPPFLGTGLIGSGGLTAAIDSYGDVVDLRLAPAGRARISNPFRRQKAGSVSPSTGITATLSVGGAQPKPLWGGSEYRQRYVPDSNVLLTSATISGARVAFEDGVDPDRPVLVRRITVSARRDQRLTLRLHVDPSIGCATGPVLWRGLGELQAELACSFDGNVPRASTVLDHAKRADRDWLGAAHPLGPGAPQWARDMYRRSLLVLRGLTNRRSGAQAAGARDFWAYVWPRDAAAGALALAAAGYEPEARRIAGFLLRLDADTAARFRSDGTPVRDQRGAPGDSTGWIRAAAAATGLASSDASSAWREHQDYVERDDQRGDHLANAISSNLSASEIREQFGTGSGLVRTAGDPGSGLDSAAAWAVIPFAQQGLGAAVQATLRQLAAKGTRFGIRPAESAPGVNPWTAPTAWGAAALARLGQDQEAGRLLAALRRAATPAGLLPERVSRSGGAPLSTTPLAWSHAWAILALQARYGAGS